MAKDHSEFDCQKALKAIQSGKPLGGSVVGWGQTNLDYRLSRVEDKNRAIFGA